MNWLEYLNSLVSGPSWGSVPPQQAANPWAQPLPGWLQSGTYRQETPDWKSSWTDYLPLRDFFRGGPAKTPQYADWGDLGQTEYRGGTGGKSGPPQSQYEQPDTKNWQPVGSYDRNQGW